MMLLFKVLKLSFKKNSQLVLLHTALLGVDIEIKISRQYYYFMYNTARQFSRSIQKPNVGFLNKFNIFKY